MYCTFEETSSCPFINSNDTRERWTLVDGNGQVKDNTLNLGITIDMIILKT
jgi:hypothetical protein